MLGIKIKGDLLVKKSFISFFIGCKEMDISSTVLPAYRLGWIRVV